jgi:hypothetical protein
MKSELRVAKHALVPGAVVVEVWHDGRFIGQVTGADGPHVRVLSKYDLTAAALTHRLPVLAQSLEPRLRLPPVNPLEILVAHGEVDDAFH